MSEIAENQNKQNKHGDRKGEEFILNTHQMEIQIKILRQIIGFDDNDSNLKKNINQKKEIKNENK